MRPRPMAETPEPAPAASGLDRVTVLRRPRPLERQRLQRRRRRSGHLGSRAGGRPASGAPPSPADARRRIERRDRTPGNARRANGPPDRFAILLTPLENHRLPGALEEQLGAYVERTHHARPHESLNTLTPADLHHGCGDAIPAERARDKRQTPNARRLQHHARAASTSPPAGPHPPLPRRPACPKSPDDGHRNRSVQLRQCQRWSDHHLRLLRTWAARGNHEDGATERHLTEISVSYNSNRARRMHAHGRAALRLLLCLADLLHVITRVAAPRRARHSGLAPAPQG